MRSETRFVLSLSCGVIAKCQLSVPSLLIAKLGEFSCFKSSYISKVEKCDTFTVLQLLARKLFFLFLNEYKDRHAFHQDDCDIADSGAASQWVKHWFLLNLQNVLLCYMQLYQQTWNVFMKNKCKENRSKGFSNSIEACHSAVLGYCYFPLLNNVCEWNSFLLFFYGIESCGLDLSILFEGKFSFLSWAGTT